MQFSKITVFGALTLLAGADGAENRELRRSKGQKGCTPSSLEGVWTHMSQGLSFTASNEGAGLRSWIVTCPRLALWNGNQGGSKEDADFVGGTGSCQIADANAQIAPLDLTVNPGASQDEINAAGTGWVGVLSQDLMKIDPYTGACSFDYVSLMPKGGADYNLYFKGIQDHENMWWLYLTNDEDDAKAGNWLNAGNPRHTTRNPR